ncbi:MAG: cation diffusion facilitator family transporter [bacterium]
MKINNKKVAVALNSVFWSLFLTLMKGVVGIITGSLGILSEALHSLLDLGAALLTFFSVRVGDKPADKKHHYGHLKIESVSALIESALLFITSGWIIYEAIKRLFFEKVEVDVVWYSFVVILISIFVDISRSRALMKVAKETNSQALEADALHFSSDIWSSCAVFIGLICAYFKVPAADTIAALVVAIVVIHAGYKLSKRTFDVLIDTAPEGLEEIVTETANNTEGVLGVSKVRVRIVGSSMFIELGIKISRKLALEKVKKITKNVEEQIKLKINNADITIHTIPTTLDNETIVEHIQILAHSQDLSVHDIAVHSIENKTFINFDLEVEASLTMEKAHETATKLEDVLKNELGNEVEIITHIEPLKSDISKGEKISQKEEKEIIAKLNNVAKNLENIYEPRSIEIRKVNDKIFISFHAYTDKNILLEKAHEESSKFEYLAKQKIDNVARIIIHLEPKE